MKAPSVAHDQGVGPADVAQADQRADREQQRQRRHDDADDDQGIAERDQEDDGAGSDGVMRRSMRSRFRSRPVPSADYRQPAHDGAMAATHRDEWPSRSRATVSRFRTLARCPRRIDAIEVQALKADSFGRIALMRDAMACSCAATCATCRCGCACRPGGWRGAKRARCERVDGLAATPQLLRWDGRRLDRSYMDGSAMYQRPPRDDLAYFRQARRLLQQLHRRGLAHNDLAKEANWLVLADGARRSSISSSPPAAIRARAGCACSRARTCATCSSTSAPTARSALTPVERRVLKRHSWLREAWFATGKPVYRFVTRRLLKWEDNEGQGPKP